MLFYLIFVGLIGLIIGKHVGRPFAGFVWGFLLGPIGWLVIFLSPAKKQVESTFDPKLYELQKLNSRMSKLEKGNTEIE